MDGEKYENVGRVCVDTGEGFIFVSYANNTSLAFNHYDVMHRVP